LDPTNGFTRLQEIKGIESYGIVFAFPDQSTAGKIAQLPVTGTGRIPRKPTLTHFR